jgi:pimeloyl-ACP methyl ester carboxylesterase
MTSFPIPSTQTPVSQPGAAVSLGQRRLVVLVPGTGSSEQEWTSLRTKLEKETGYGPADADWYFYNHGARLWQRGHVSDLARNLRARIDGEWAEHQGYAEIVLIGHSLGGLLVRQAYLLAAGAVPEELPSAWWTRVSRIILFAATNRGIDLERIGWRKQLAKFLLALPRPHVLGEDALRGSNFLVDLRIDWIRHFGWLEAGGADKLSLPNLVPNHIPRVIQFLGTADELVTHGDSKDILAFQNSRYVEIADANHADLFRLDVAPDPAARYAVIREAILEDPASNLPANPAPPTPSALINDVVFLLHGIRASNVDSWITQLAETLQLHDPVRVRVVPPTYGYFSALGFALPWTRKKNIRFFQDAYSEELAKHPNAQFQIIAHSNGSYMLGSSLAATRGIRFENVVLAGCVLPPDYAWEDLMESEKGQIPQVGRVLNERASRDVPVAILTNLLRGLFMMDIGPSGFSGFLGSDVFEVAYHKGGHGQALHPHNHPRLVNFVFGGPNTKPSDLVRDPGIYRQLSNMAPGLAWIIVAAFLVLLILALYQGFYMGSWLLLLIFVPAVLALLWFLDIL